MRTDPAWCYDRADSDYDSLVGEFMETATDIGLGRDVKRRQASLAEFIARRTGRLPERRTLHALRRLYNSVRYELRQPLLDAYRDERARAAALAERIREQAASIAATADRIIELERGLDKISTALREVAPAIAKELLPDASEKGEAA